MIKNLFQAYNALIVSLMEGTVLQEKNKKTKLTSRVGPASGEALKHSFLLRRSYIFKIYMSKKKRGNF